MGKDSVIIIDYGSGNLRSAEKAFAHVIAEEGLDFTVKVSGNPADIKKAARIVLPGQGAFPDCMNALKNIKGMIAALEDSVLQRGTPFFGICVGMQLMMTRGLEHGVTAGLDWIPGQVVPMQPSDASLKIPHMGWNELSAPPPVGEQDNHHFVLRSIKTPEKAPEHYYFVHSFMVECEYDHHVLGRTDYGGLVTAAIGRDNMVGVQFHPEKSQAAGLRMISDFLHWKP